MEWFVAGVVVVFLYAILTSDYWLDKIFGTQPLDTWDETARWNEIRSALEPELEKKPGGTDNLVYYDFRRKREDHPTQENQ